MTDLFGVGQRAAAQPSTTLIASVSAVIVERNVRCGGERPQGRCGLLLAEQLVRTAEETWVIVCRRCGYRNEGGSGGYGGVSPNRQGRS